jgi:hypothetical protein
VEGVTLDAERLAAAKLEEERLEAAKLEKGRLEAVTLEEERLEAAKQEKERLEAVKLELADALLPKQRGASAPMHGRINQRPSMLTSAPVAGETTALIRSITAPVAPSESYFSVDWKRISIMLVLALLAVISYESLVSRPTGTSSQITQVLSNIIKSASITKEQTDGRPGRRFRSFN